MKFVTLIALVATTNAGAAPELSPMWPNIAPCPMETCINDKCCGVVTGIDAEAAAVAPADAVCAIAPTAADLKNNPKGTFYEITPADVDTPAKIGTFLCAVPVEDDGDCRAPGSVCFAGSCCGKVLGWGKLLIDICSAKPTKADLEYGRREWNHFGKVYPLAGVTD